MIAPFNIENWQKHPNTIRLYGFFFGDVLVRFAINTDHFVFGAHWDMKTTTNKGNPAWTFVVRFGPLAMFLSAPYRSK